MKKSFFLFIIPFTAMAMEEGDLKSPYLLQLTDEENIYANQYDNFLEFSSISDQQLLDSLQDPYQSNQNNIQISDPIITQVELPLDETTTSINNLKTLLTSHQKTNGKKRLHEPAEEYAMPSKRHKGNTQRHEENTTSITNTYVELNSQSASNKQTNAIIIPLSETEFQINLEAAGAQTASTSSSHLSNTDSALPQKENMPLPKRFLHMKDGIYNILKVDCCKQIISHEQYKKESKIAQQENREPQCPLCKTYPLRINILRQDEEKCTAPQKPEDIYQIMPNNFVSPNSVFHFDQQSSQQKSIDLPRNNFFREGNFAPVFDNSALQNTSIGSIQLPLAISLMNSQKDIQNTKRFPNMKDGIYNILRVNCCKQIISQDHYKKELELAKQIHREMQCPICKTSPLSISILKQEDNNNNNTK